MKNFHLLSFGAGVALGIVMLVLIGVGMRLIPTTPQPQVRMQQGQDGPVRGANMSRMAERMGMTEAELQKEIDSGKTMQQIATERGVAAPGGFGARGPMSGSGRMMTGSGTAATGAMMMRSSLMSSSSAR